MTKQHRDAYIVTGPVFEGKRLKTIGNGVIVPTAVYKAVYLPKQGLAVPTMPNNDSQQVRVVSICYLEEKLGVNLFPQLTEQQKRNIYQLPLSAAQVKANQDIKYMRWDAEKPVCGRSRYRQHSGSTKQFASGQTQTAESKLPQIDEETKQA